MKDENSFVFKVDDDGRVEALRIIVGDTSHMYVRKDRLMCYMYAFSILNDCDIKANSFCEMRYWANLRDPSKVLLDSHYLSGKPKFKVKEIEVF